MATRSSVEIRSPRRSTHAWGRRVPGDASRSSSEVFHRRKFWRRRDDCLGAVPIAEVDDIRVREAHARPLGRACGVEVNLRMCHANEGLIERELCHRAALVLIGIEERRACIAAEHEGEFPGQIMRVRDTRAHPKSAGRRHDVCGIPGEEYPPLLETIREARGDLPREDAEDFDREIGHADGGAHQCTTALGGEIVRALAPLRVIGEVKHPAATIADTDEHTGRLRGTDLAECERMVADEGSQVRLEEHIDEWVGQRSRSARRDAEEAAHGTLGAVGSDHIGGVDGISLAAPPMCDLCRHARGILRERHEFAVEKRGRAMPPRIVPKHRIEHILGADDLACRAEWGGEDLEALPVRGCLVARFARFAPANVSTLIQPPLPANPAAAFRICLLQADTTEQLHRAHAEADCTRMNRRARVSLDDHHRNPAVREENRRREPDTAAADDQNRNIGTWSSPFSLTL